MSSDIIPEDIRQFLLQNVDTIAQWEGLLLIRSTPGQAWSAEILARRLYIDKTESEKLLEHLRGQGFLTAEGMYQSKAGDIEALIDRAAGLYKEYLIPITHLIHSKPKTRIQGFADAFRLRKD